MRPLILLLFFSNLAFGQSLEELGKSLKEKKFVPFYNLTKDYPKKNIEFRWELLRTIVGNYKEGVLKMVEYPPLDKDGKGGYLKNFSLYIITTGEDIISYRLTKTINEKVGNDKWVGKEITVDSFENSEQYKAFENLFQQTYGVSINRKDLFVFSIVYGLFCGYSGEIPEYQEKLSNFVKARKVDEIRQWLKSANAEKQIYAIQGFKALARTGYLLTGDEKRIIGIIRKKEGSVSTCSGCIYSKKSIQKAISEMD